MSECPFCGTEVPDDLVTYGGPCPKCFAEIPGEEAPTDPGAEARAIQERKDRRGATIRAFVGLAAMAAVVSCTGVAAVAVVLWPEPEVAVLDFDQLDYGYDYPDLVAKDDLAPEDANDGVAAAEGEPKPQPGPKAPRPKVDVSKYQGGGYTGDEGGPASAKDGLSDDGVAAVDDGTRVGTRGGTEAAEGPKDIGDIEGPTTKSGGIGLDIGPDVSRRSEVLTDPDAIVQMIGKLMGANIKRLKQCYERELKTNPELGGRWLIKYTVTKDGKAINASATGRDQANAELEDCMVKNIETQWKFDRIVRDQPVQKTLTFRPN